MAACSSTTTYQPAEKRGGYGYTETELGKDRYRVTFTGNTVTDKETVNDYALLRAAELTLQQGYDWFQLVNRDTESKSRTSSSISGVNDFGGGTAVYQRCGLLSCDTVVAQTPGRLSGGYATSTTLNGDPMAAWFFRLKPSDASALEGFMDEDAYKALVG